MTVSPKKPASVLDRPNSYIGRSVPRPNAKKLLEGRGHYAGDTQLPGMLHVAYSRSPYAHAKILSIDSEDAGACEGVVLIATGEDIARVCSPWIGVLDHFAGMKSAPQNALAIGKAHWQGEPVVAVVAETRAQAEDAVELIYVDWQELPAVTDMETALDPETPVIHEQLGDNLAFNLKLKKGETDQVFAAADHGKSVV